jgi:hypothetical protein
VSPARYAASPPRQLGRSRSATAAARSPRPRVRPQARDPLAMPASQIIQACSAPDDRADVQGCRAGQGSRVDRTGVRRRGRKSHGGVALEAQEERQGARATFRSGGQRRVVRGGAPFSGGGRGSAPCRRIPRRRDRSRAERELDAFRAGASVRVLFLLLCSGRHLYDVVQRLPERCRQRRPS